MAKIHFTKNRKKRNFSENRKIQPHALFKRRTAGDMPQLIIDHNQLDTANLTGAEPGPQAEGLGRHPDRQAGRQASFRRSQVGRREELRSPS